MRHQHGWEDPVTMSPLLLVYGYLGVGLCIAVGLTLRVWLLDMRRHPFGNEESERSASRLLDRASDLTDRPLAWVFFATLLFWPVIFW